MMYKNLLIIFAVLIKFNFSLAEEYCPVPYGHIEFDLHADVIKKQNGTSKFSYVISSSGNSKFDVSAIEIAVREFDKDLILSNSKWSNKLSDKESNLQWYSSQRKFALKPNHKVSGFSLESGGDSGVVEVTANASVDVANIQYTNVKNDFKTACPGWWGYGSSAGEDFKPKSIAIGPIPKDTVSPMMLIRKINQKSWTGLVNHNSTLSISPEDTGKVEVILIGSENFDVSDVDLKTIQFGRGEAKVSSSKIISKDQEIIFNDQNISQSNNNLLMQFDLQEMNVLCDIDQALILKGKTNSGKKIFTGVKIKPTWCNLATFKKEAKKINIQH